MAFEDDFFDATDATKTTTLTAGVNTYYDKKFLRQALVEIVLGRYGQKRPLPGGEGKTIEFFRYHKIPVSTTALTEGVNPDATLITGQKIQATIGEYGGFSQHTSLLKKTHIDKNLAGVAGLWGENAGRTVELLCQKEVCSNGIYPMRADADAAKKFTGVVDSATSTTLVDALLAGNADYGNGADDLNQSIIIITSGTAYGQARTVTDYDEGDGTCTVPTWDTTPAAGDTFVVVSPDAITSSDKLTTTNLISAVTQLRNNGAAPMEDGWYVGVISHTQMQGLMSDTNWVNAAQYKDTENGLRTAKVAYWGGVKFHTITDSFRFPIETIGTSGTAGGPGDAGANYSTSGTVETALVLGREAFGVTTFDDQGGRLRPGIKTKISGPQDTSNPLDRYSTVGWAMPFVCKALNPMFSTGIWTGV